MRKVEKNTLNCMVSHNRYRIYEGSELYFFLLDKKNTAVYALGGDVFESAGFPKRLIMFEQEAYRSDAGYFDMMNRFASEKEPDLLYRKISGSPDYTLIADENGRYEDRMGQKALKCFADEAYYFTYKSREKAGMPAPLYGEYIKVIASDIHTARFYMNLCYPSMLDGLASYSNEYCKDDWEKEGCMDYTGRNPYDLITKEKIVKEFGSASVYNLFTKKEKFHFGMRVAKPRKVKPYMTAKEAAQYQRLINKIG